MCTGIIRNVEISILMMTYNHEQYIRRALDSVLMQKIDMSYEIIIIDDASTDMTPDILREYKKKYPQIISLYLRKVNSCNPTKNGYFLLSKAKGNYLTVIEGDDYWIDDLKIQKQYEFLIKNPKYSACITDVVVVDENSKEIDIKVYEKKDNHIYTMEDFRNQREPGMTVSLFCKNYFDKENYRIIYKADKMMGDITVYMLCLLKGNIYQLDEKMSAYRYINKKGENNFNSIQVGNIYRNYMQIRYWIRLENFMKQYDSNFEFAPMLDNIKQLAIQYPTKICLKLFAMSKNNIKYTVIYFIYKFLMDSNYLSDSPESYCKKEKYSWNCLKNEKRPLVLFGAGAVAEEYINKYGWKENILFLVDNAQDKQNTSLKGYLVKEPREILKYKNRIKVVITNKDYEKDIATQLYDMGINEYYCYCTIQNRRMRNVISKKILRMLGQNSV